MEKRAEGNTKHRHYSGSLTQHRHFILNTLQTLRTEGGITDCPNNIEAESLDGRETASEVAPFKPDNSPKARNHQLPESSVVDFHPDAGEEIITSDQLNIPTLGSSPVCQKCDRPLTGKSARALGGTFIWSVSSVRYVMLLNTQARPCLPCLFPSIPQDYSMTDTNSAIGLW